MQEFTSANTSLNQIPAVAKMINFNEINCLLDYGCGKYDAFKQHVEGFGVEYHGFDPYHKNNVEELNCEPDIIVCANVLNVIKEDFIIYSILDELSDYDAKVYIQIYEGNKSGQGKPTKKGCYQRNMKTVDYMNIAKIYFDFVERKGNVLICSN